MATFREINRGDGSGTTLYYRMDVADTLDLNNLDIDKETILYKTGLEISQMSSEPQATVFCTEDYDYVDKEGHNVSVKNGNIYQIEDGIIINTYGQILTDDTQAFSGKKVFDTIPELDAYVAPTSNKQLVAKKYVDDKMLSVYRYKGTVLTYDDLPDSDLTIGDVYNIETADSTHGIKAGDNVAWTGSVWDVLGGITDISGKQDVFQFETMPTASVDNLGQVIQYTGITNSNYTNCYFYQCVSDEGDPAAYSWENIDVQQTPPGGMDVMYRLNNSNNKFNFDIEDKGHYYINQTANAFYYKIGTRETTLTSYTVLELVLYKKFNEAEINEQIGFIICYDISTSIATNGKYIRLLLTKDASDRINFGSLSYGKDSLMFLTSDLQRIDGIKTFSNIPKQFPLVSPTQDEQFTNKKYVDDQIASQIVQYDTVPEASSLLLSKIIQYTGTTDSNYINGFFYECVSDGEDTPTYFWQQLNVQPENLSGKVNVAPYPSTAAKQFDFRNKKAGVYYFTYHGFNINARFYYHINSDASTYGGLLSITLFKDIGPEFDLNDFEYNEDFAVLEYYDVENTLVQQYYRKIERYGEPALWTYSNYYGKPVTSEGQLFYGVKQFQSFPRINNQSNLPVNDGDFATKRYVDNTAATYSVMPASSATTVGKVVQYVGDTDANYTQGYFYIGVSDENDPPTYSWEQIDIQPSASMELDSAKFGGLTDSDQANALVLDGKKPGVYFPTSRPTYLKWYVKAESNKTAITETTYYPIMVMILKEYSEAAVGDVLAIVPSLSTGTVIDALTIRTIVKSSNTYGISFGGGSADLNTMLVSGSSNTQRFYGPKIFGTTPQISSYVAPTLDTHLVAKKYVDDQLAIAETSVYVLPLTSSSNPFDFRTAALGTYIAKPQDIGQQFYYRQNDNSVQVLSMARLTQIFVVKHANEVTGTEPIAYYTYVSGSNTGTENGKTYINSIEYNVTTGEVSQGSTPNNNGQLVTMSAQTFTGRKTFGANPYVSLYTAPTQNTELTPKKYVDDKIASEIGNINTILATLTTPSNGGGN